MVRRLRPAVVIAAATYRRPDDLAALLPLLIDAAAAAAGPARSVRILIVDNDPDAGAGDLVASIAGDSPVEVTYAHEPQPGISAARNTALRLAEQDDLLVFIDDDERPGDGWLDHLLRTWQEQHEPAAVAGRVLSQWDGELDPWVAAGRFFDRRRHPTGTVVPIAATNNLLLDLRQVRAAELSFALELGLVGGSDTLFTRQLTAAGGRIVWCDEGFVIDRVPADRMTKAWVLTKARRIGNSQVLVALMTASSRRERVLVRLRAVADGAPRVLAGAALMLWGTVGRRLAHRARGRRLIARGAGMLAGAAGSRVQEYARPVDRSVAR